MDWCNRAEGAPFLGARSALVALTSSCSPKEPCLYMHYPRLSPLTLSTHPPALQHFFVAELTVCPVPASRCRRPRPFPGTNSQGILSGFNKTVLRTLPRSRNLIVVESVLMATAFLAMLLVRPGTGVGRETGRVAGGLGRVATWGRGLWSESGTRAAS